MEKTKDLENAVRLRDAYILFMEAVRKWDNIQSSSIFDNTDDGVKYWDFYRNVDIDTFKEESYEIDCLNVVFMMSVKYKTPIIVIACELDEIKKKVLEILKDYKDLIK